MSDVRTAARDRPLPGDIFDDCPILVWKPAPPPLDLNVPPEIRIIRVVVLTQACDLAQDKTTRVVVAPVHDAAELVAKNILKAVVIRDQVRRGQVFGSYFLPARPRLSPCRNRSWIFANCTRSNGERWSIWSAPASTSAAFGLPGTSTWPNISARPTCALPCPNPTPRSRDRRREKMGRGDTDSGPENRTDTAPGCYRAGGAYPHPDRL